jgi:hypothetical protein
MRSDREIGCWCGRGPRYGQDHEYGFDITTNFLNSTQDGGVSSITSTSLSIMAFEHPSHNCLSTMLALLIMGVQMRLFKLLD